MSVETEHPMQPGAARVCSMSDCRAAVIDCASPAGTRHCTVIRTEGDSILAFLASRAHGLQSACHQLKDQPGVDGKAMCGLRSAYAAPPRWRFSIISEHEGHAGRERGPAPDHRYLALI